VRYGQYFSFGPNENCGPGQAGGSLSQTRYGGTFGGGLEYAITPNWSVNQQTLFKLTVSPEKCYKATFSSVLASGFAALRAHLIKSCDTRLIVLLLKVEISDRCWQCRPACSASNFWRSFHGELAKQGGCMLRTFGVLAFVVVTSTSGSPAAAQDNWPSKPITVIVPFGAGGNTDVLARIYSAQLSARLGQQFVIENRVGAGSTTD
jgi:hypothetical protein